MEQRVTDKTIDDAIRMCEEIALRQKIQPDRVYGWDMAMDLRDARSALASQTEANQKLMAQVGETEFANVELSHEVELYKSQVASQEATLKGMREAMVDLVNMSDFGLLTIGRELMAKLAAPEASK